MEVTTTMTAASSRKGLGGPRTPEGRKRSSLNALKHGLTARSKHGMEEITRVVGATYLDFVEVMTRHYRPIDPVEDTLVRRIARCAWRIHLSEKMEDHILNRRGWTTSPHSGRESLIRAERLIDVQLHRAIETLYKKRALMTKKAPNELMEPFCPSVPHARFNPEFLLPETNHFPGKTDSPEGDSPATGEPSPNQVPGSHPSSQPEVP